MKFEQNGGQNFFLYRRVPPLDRLWKKLLTRKFFIKNVKNGLSRTFLILQGTNSSKISLFGASTDKWRMMNDQSKDSMSYSEELLVLFKKSPKREAKLKDLKLEQLKNSLGLPPFSKTRWTVRCASLSDTVLNYSLCLNTLKESYCEEEKK